MKKNNLNEEKHDGIIKPIPHKGFTHSLKDG
jgi:hypothetical protein